MGGSLAAHAARGGHDVQVVDTSPEVRARIRESGLSVRAPEGEFTADVKCVEDLAAAGPADLIVLFVKGEHTAAATRSILPMVGPDTVVATLQNGWGNADVIGNILPVEQVVLGVTYNSCTAAGPGQVVHSGRGPTIAGPLQGADLMHAETLVRVLNDSQWEATCSENVRTEIWKKLVLNCATLPPAALTRLSAGAIGASPDLLPLVDALAAESVEVARAQGLEVELAERIGAIHRTLDRAGDGKASMLQDVLAGRRTEIETINAAVVREGDRLGVDVPLNRLMVRLVDGLQRSYLS